MAGLAKQAGLKLECQMEKKDKMESIKRSWNLPCY